MISKVLSAKYKLLFLSFLMGLIVFAQHVLAQRGSLNQSNVFIDTAKGDQSWRIGNFNINGNNVESIITNWGTVGNGNATINQAGVWPKGTGHGTIHEMTGLIAAYVYDKSGQRLAIVSDGYGGSRVDLPEEQDPITNIRYKFQPIPGYFNPTIANPELANSRNESSWPLQWPDRDASWNGAWNGYFGLNQFNADQEVFYVMDDLSNKEYRYYPIGGDTTKGGLGVQIRVRLFQWSQALAKDIIFMQYEVSNIGDSTYTNSMQNNPIIFGGYTDINASGSGATDDDAFFNVDEDIVYGWSFTGVGRWTQFRDIPPGYVGWKFLESPGIDTDLIDNDNDGLMDESRDNDAGNLVFGPIGIYGAPKEHWSGDEDGDWNPLLDDVGSDGIGPDGDGYPGPDADGSEANGRPDQGEPNFGRLDNDESDQVGLTSFQVEDPARQSIHDENALWPLLTPNTFDVAFRNNNQAWIFGSGPFNLVPNRSQRFSTAFVWGVNEDAMFRAAQVAQRIYDSDYRFARPPRQPKLQAIPGDGKVTLVWDNLAEFSNDPIYGRDFEGYRILKSTDPQFNDAVDITDGFGNPVYKRGIAQFDKINGLKGYHPLQFGEEIGLPNGVHYWMGTDNGLQHSYVDTDVINGRIYYYAIIAYDAGYVADFYDKGISEFEFLFPISPSESPASITVEQGVITNYDRNTASARPNPPPSDYKVGTLSVDAQNRVPVIAGTATGTVKARLVDDRLLRNATFTITFEQTPINAEAVEYVTSTFSVTDNDGLLIVDREPIPTDLNGKVQDTWSYEILEEGFVLEFENQNPDLTFTQQRSKWSENSATNLLPFIDLTPTFAFPIPPKMPVNVSIEIVADGQGDSLFTSTTGNLNTRVLTNMLIRNSDTGEPVKAIFIEKDSTRNGKIDIDETIQIAFKRKPTSAALVGSWRITFRNPVDASNVNLPFSEVVKPQPGDRYDLRTMIPFGEKDTLAFVATEPAQIANAPKSILDDIVVVPNPYIVATITEGRPFLAGRGERRIEFRNLPTQARLKIFSASGVFIKEVEVIDGLGVFNLQNKDGQEVAFGLYFYHVEAPGIGEKVGKFAIIN